MDKNWKDWDIVITGGDVKEKAAYVYSCMKACANLPEPEKNIRLLVEHFTGCHDFVWDAPTQGQARHKAGERPEECGGCYALAPFKEKQNERPLD